MFVPLAGSGDSILSTQVRPTFRAFAPVTRDRSVCGLHGQSAVAPSIWLARARLWSEVYSTLVHCRCTRTCQNHLRDMRLVPSTLSAPLFSYGTIPRQVVACTTPSRPRSTPQRYGLPSEPPREANSCPASTRRRAPPSWHSRWHLHTSRVHRMVLVSYEIRVRWSA